MNFNEWLALASVCVLGAVSPGPSLFVILRAAIHGGRWLGVVTGIAHAVAVAIYAVGAIVVLSGVLAVGEGALMAVQTLGVVWLLKLSWGLWHSRAGQMDISASASVRDGFLIAFLNPKMLAFFLAVFSPFVTGDGGFQRNLVLVATPAIIDGVWYSIAAIVLSAAAMRQALLARAVLLNRAMALVLASIAVLISYRLLTSL